MYYTVYNLQNMSNEKRCTFSKYKIREYLRYKARKVEYIIFVCQTPNGNSVFSAKYVYLANLNGIRF